MAAIGASINELIANFQGGGARPNLYEVLLQFPVGVANPFVSRKASFTCRAASLPASSIGMVVVPFMGRYAKVAGDVDVQDWSITIINDADFSVRDAFERWINLISGIESNVAAPGFSNPSRYFASARVNQLDREHRTIKSYKFDGMFPTNVSEISLAYDPANQVEEFLVSLAVNSWSSNTTN